MKSNIGYFWRASGTQAEISAKFGPNGLCMLVDSSKRTQYLISLFWEKDASKGYIMLWKWQNVHSILYVQMQAQTCCDLAISYFLRLRVDSEWPTNRALEATLELDEAIETALEMVNLEETLVIVTADHSHVFTLSGYSDRGSDIRGLASRTLDDGLPYSILRSQSFTSLMVDLRQDINRVSFI